MCLLNVMSKLYMAGAMQLTRSWAEQHLDSSWTTGLLFGFEADCPCEDLRMCLQALVPSGGEWPAQRSVLIASAAVRHVSPGAGA